MLFLLSLGESITEWIASNINGDLFIGCICGAIIVIIIMSIVKPNKLWIDKSSLSATLIFLILYKLRLINTTNTLIVLGGHGACLNNSKT